MRECPPPIVRTETVRVLPDPALTADVEDPQPADHTIGELLDNRLALKAALARARAQLQGLRDWRAEEDKR